MSRIINPENAGKERTRLVKCIVLAIRELAKLDNQGLEWRDPAAFIALALHRISETIDITVTAWEKRDYWVKADKFRMEWTWTGQYADKMNKAVKSNDWESVAGIAAQTAQKLIKITVPTGHRLGKPWLGAWNEMISK